MSANTFSDGTMNEVCNQLDVTLTGHAADMVPEGVESDGYQASYTYDVTNELAENDMVMTCFGFDGDDYGYFCVGVVS